MNLLTNGREQAFDRLQDLLLAMRTGDELCTSDAARISGLSEPVCLAVLEALERAGLMEHQRTGTFVRRTLQFA
jgi:hypothetical protein